MAVFYLPRLNTRRIPKVRKPTEKSKFGYASLSLRKDTVDHLKAEFKTFQDASGKRQYGNPLKTDFLDLLITLYRTPQDKLPRLIFVSSGPTRSAKSRTVLYDTKIRRPVVVELDNKGRASCTRAEEIGMYIDFARKASQS